jgi:hypothetical protein
MLCTLRRGQFTAGAGVTVRRRDAVRGGGGGPDLRPRAITGVEHSLSIEPCYGLLVQFHPPRLVCHGSVPVESEGPEIGELCLLHSGTHPRAVEVLHTYEEPRPGRAREQPR